MSAFNTMKSQAGTRMIGTFVTQNQEGRRSRITSHFNSPAEFFVRINNNLWAGSLILAELNGQDVLKQYHSFIADLPF